MHILGIPIDNLTREEILARVELSLDEPKFYQTATVNPEFLLEAEKNKDFRAALEQCDMRIADGFGITLAFLFKGKKLKYRFPGSDLMEEILQMAERKNLSVYLAIKKDGLSSYDEIKSSLLKKYPRLKVNGADIDSKIHDSRFMILDSIVLCNFGAPAQELFLSQLRNTGQKVRLAMGVGGSFDYLTGKLERAPRILRSLGLEWLWRLIQQPKRWRRIWKAVIIFPIRILTK